MNKQIIYIVYAYLLLMSISAMWLVVEKIPFSSIVHENTQQAFCGTGPAPDKKLSSTAAKGKMLFNNKCAACHSFLKDMTGPALSGLLERGPWADSQKLLTWIQNPAAFMKKDPYTRALQKSFGSMMTAFPEMTMEDLQSILAYINSH